MLSIPLTGWLLGTNHQPIQLVNPVKACQSPSCWMGWNNRMAANGEEWQHHGKGSTGSKCPHCIIWSKGSIWGRTQQIILPMAVWVRILFNCIFCQIVRASLCQVQDRTYSVPHCHSTFTLTKHIQFFWYLVGLANVIFAPGVNKLLPLLQQR